MRTATSGVPSSALLDAAFEHAGVALCLVAPDGTVLRANAEWLRSTGLTREEAIGSDLLELFPEHRPLAERLHARARAGETVDVPCHATRARGGAEVWWEGRISPVPTGKGVGLLITCFDVTAEVARQREAEAALRDGEAFLRKVIDAAPSMVFVKDREGRFVLANEALARCYGTSVSEIVGKGDADFNPLAEEVASFRRDDLAVMNTRRPQRIAEEPVRHASGEVRWYTTVKVPLERDGGRCDQVLGISTDITELKRTEDHLRASEERFLLLNRATRDVIWDWDIASGALVWNEALEATFGYRAEEVPRDIAWWVERIHPEDRERMQASLNAALGDPARPSWSGEYRFRHASGGWCHVLDRGHIARDPTSRATRMIGSMLEVTDQKLAEQALRRSEAQLRALADAMPQLVWTNRADGGAEFYNRQWREYTGTSLEDAQGDGWMRLLHPDDRARTIETWRRSLATGEPYAIEYRLRSASDGAYRWFLARALPVRDEAGKLVRWFGTCTDIDERKRVESELVNAERAIRASERLLREEHRRKDAFLGMLSHELRNPLAPIRSAVFLLRHAGPERADAALQVIERQTAHLTRLVDDLLDVTRIARGKIQLRRERIDLRDVVRRTGEDFRSVLEERGVRFRVTVPERGLWVDADATRLAQVLGNLLHNAAKFTGRGDEVDLSAAARGQEVEVQVRDTGAGIDPALLPSVFEPFVQSERTLARTEGGLGLGLALVKGIVELHGGSATAESDGTGRGSRFTVVLPLVVPAPEAEERPGPPLTPREGRRRVLIVDDNRDAADSLAELVRLLGHEPEIAYDAESALDAARRRSPDAVLCDIGLPGMDGYEVARRIRSSPAARIRLVALSGYAQPEDVARAIEAGFDAHLAKPADPARIEDLLRELPGTRPR